MRSGPIQVALGIALGGAVAVALYIVARSRFPNLGLPAQIPANRQ